MKFNQGDWVKVTREGISDGSLGAIVGREIYNGKSIYRVILLEMPEVELTCAEEDLVNWTESLKNKNLPSICECGGDKLEIPHHYEWCPKG